MKKLLAILTTLVMFGCSSPKALMNNQDGSYDYYALKDALGAYLGKPVKIYIADMEIESVLSGLESDRLIIRQGERVQEIPIRAISRLEMNEVKKSLLATGSASAVGAVLGWLGGKLVSSEVLASQWQKFKSDDKQIAAAAAGATIGFLAGAWFGSKKGSNVLDINPNVEPLILDRAVGRWITGSKRQEYGLFMDLPLVATESLARVQIFQYGPTDYLIVYDSFEQPELPKYAYDGREVTVKIPAAQMKLSWMAVGREYLVREQDKIHKTLNYEEGTLKYRLFEQ